MKIEPAPETENQEQETEDGAVAAAAAALLGADAIRSARVAPGRSGGGWMREGRKAIQSSHRLSDPFGLGRERATRNRTKLWVQVDGKPYEVEVDANQPAARQPRRSGALSIPEAVLRPRPPQRLPEDSVCRSPIAGRVIAVFGAPGRAVRRNEPVILIEAMKMEIPIGPAVDGTVGAIHVEPGQAVAARQALFDLV